MELFLLLLLIVVYRCSWEVPIWHWRLFEWQFFSGYIHMYVSTQRFGWRLLVAPKCWTTNLKTTFERKDGLGVQYHIKSHVNIILTIPDGFQLRPRHPYRCWVLVVLHLYCNLQRPLGGQFGDVLCHILSCWFLEMMSPTKWAAKTHPHDEIGNFGVAPVVELLLRVWHMICYTSSLEANQL